MPEVVTIYIAAENEAALVTRLVGRATEPVDKLLTRVQTAREVRGLPACTRWLQHTALWLTRAAHSEPKLRVPSTLPAANSHLLLLIHAPAAANFTPPLPAGDRAHGRV